MHDPLAKHERALLSIDLLSPLLLGPEPYVREMKMMEQFCHPSGGRSFAACQVNGVVLFSRYAIRVCLTTALDTISHPNTGLEPIEIIAGLTWALP